MTLNIYSHVIPAMHADAVQQLNTLLSQPENAVAVTVAVSSVVEQPVQTGEGKEPKSDFFSGKIVAVGNENFIRVHETLLQGFTSIVIPLAYIQDE